MLYNISEIQKDYPNWYDSDSELTKDEQQWVWENLALPEDEDKRLLKNITHVSDNAYESVNGGYKNAVKNESNWIKPKIVLQLKQCTAKNSLKEISLLMEALFSEWPSHEGHWLWIAQTYTVRAINWQVSATIKESLRGAIRKTPPAHFTYEISYRTKKKIKHRGYVLRRK